MRAGREKEAPGSLFRIGVQHVKPFCFFTFNEMCTRLSTKGTSCERRTSIKLMQTDKARVSTALSIAP